MDSQTEAACVDELSNGLQYVPLPSPVPVSLCDLCLQSGEVLTHNDANHMDLCDKCITNPETEGKLQNLFRDVLTIMNQHGIEIPKAIQDKLNQPTEAMIKACMNLLVKYLALRNFGKSDEGEPLLPFPIENMEQLQQVCMAFVLTVMMLIHNNELVIE